MATAERTYPVTEGLTALKLAGTIQQIIQSEGQGQLGIKIKEGAGWTLFFDSGRVVWASGGEHRWRRWYRQLRQLRIHPHSIDTPMEGYPLQMEHFVLTQLYKQRRITRKSMQFAIDNTVNEVLFDAFLAAGDIIEVSCNTNQGQDMPESPVTVLGSYDESIARAHASLRAWQVTELGIRSPNLAPCVNEANLRQHGRALPESHERFLNILNGKRSIRDLAVKVQKDLTTLARLLSVYCEQGIVELVQVEDLPQPQAAPATSGAPPSPGPVATVAPESSVTSINSHAPAPTGAKSVITPVANTPATPAAPTAPEALKQNPLIMCIDDSPQICYIMEQMLTDAGYRVVCVQEAVEAVSTILRNKPAFIFLDLVMPVASGYELCKQIRRVSAFKDIPIVILTGNDGVIDRVRAKMVGATDFVGKPVKADKILPLLEKHLTEAGYALIQAS